MARSFFVIITFMFLTAAEAGLWLQQKERFRLKIWHVLFFLSLAFGLYAKVIHPLGLVFIGSFWFFCSICSNIRINLFIRGWAIISVALFTLLMFAHAVPGFSNPRIISQLRLSQDSVPYTLYYNFDKAAAGLLLVGFFSGSFIDSRNYVKLIKDVFSKGIAVICCVMALALLMKYVKIDIKYPSFFPLWAWPNLFFTCFAEEAFFRGFLQKRIAGRLWQVKFGSVIAIIAASILFGLAHYAGGAKYIFLATISGIGYGWVYHKNGFIESSILVHFFLNAVHFLFFTYPALA